MAELKIKTRKIADLIHAEYNPRRLKKDQHKQLTDSLKRFGIVDPVIVNQHKDRKDIIVGGHQRCRVWGDMGNDTIPTVEVSLTFEQERELNIRLNKNSGEWDWDEMMNHFGSEELIEWGFQEWETSIGSVDKINSEDTEWVGMPEFDAKEATLKIIVHFENEEDREEFANKHELEFMKKESTAWSTSYPLKERDDLISMKYE